MKENWIEQGYKDFALTGPESLSVHHMASEMSVSRSTFYHYFGDLDVFIDSLLSRHWEICLEFNKAGKANCKQMMPDLYLALSEHPIPLQFSRQLFLNRQDPRFQFLFEKTYDSTAKTFGLKLFAEYIHIRMAETELLKLFKTLGDAWYARIDPNDLSAQAMQKHAEEVIDSLTTLINSDLYNKIKK